MPGSGVGKPGRKGRRDSGRDADSFVLIETQLALGPSSDNSVAMTFAFLMREGKFLFPSLLCQIEEA